MKNQVKLLLVALSVAGFSGMANLQAAHLKTHVSSCGACVSYFAQSEQQSEPVVTKTSQSSDESVKNSETTNDTDVVDQSTEEASESTETSLVSKRKVTQEETDVTEPTTESVTESVVV